MFLKRLQVQGFRSYRVKTFKFDKGTSLVVGNNAVGKTNLMEAIWMLAVGKSFRATNEVQLIRNGDELARVEGKFGEDDLEMVVTRGEVGGERVPKKRYLVNGVAKRRMDFVGKLKVVLFRPEDLELFLGSPAVRRNYLDDVLEQVDSEYRRSLLTYKKGLRQRNKVLWKIREGEAQRGQLLFWDKLLIKNGEVLMEKREEFIKFVSEAFERARISKIFGGLEMVYDQSIISPARIEKYAEREVAAGVTLVGPHRDDFSIVTSNKKQGTKRGRDLAVFGSRGEQRLAVLALKLAELSFVTSKVGERPVLLLDDIFSELDHEHRADVLEVVGQQQTILTTTDLHLVENKYRKKMKVYRI